MTESNNRTKEVYDEVSIDQSLKNYVYLIACFTRTKIKILLCLAPVLLGHEYRQFQVSFKY